MIYLIALCLLLCSCGADNFIVQNSSLSCNYVSAPEIVDEFEVEAGRPHYLNRTFVTPSGNILGLGAADTSATRTKGYVRTSIDSGKTWGTSLEYQLAINKTTNFYSVLNYNSKLLLFGTAIDAVNVSRVKVFSSTDEGLNWGLVGTYQDGASSTGGITREAVIKMDNGDIYLAATSGTLALMAKSSDEGASWSTDASYQLIAAQSANFYSLKKMSNGNVLVTGRSKNTSGFYVAVALEYDVVAKTFTPISTYQETVDKLAIFYDAVQIDSTFHLFGQSTNAADLISGLVYKTNATDPAGVSEYNYESSYNSIFTQALLAGGNYLLTGYGYDALGGANARGLINRYDPETGSTTSIQTFRIYPGVHTSLNGMSATSSGNLFLAPYTNDATNTTSVWRTLKISCR